MKARLEWLSRDMEDLVVKVPDDTGRNIMYI
jgi:hypothetical protein